MGRNVIDSPTSAFTVTNWTEDLTLSGTETTAANIAATLATVIKELQDQGILNGSTSAP
jgi:hypothetical protein